MWFASPGIACFASGLYSCASASIHSACVHGRVHVSVLYECVILRSVWVGVSRGKNSFPVRTGAVAGVCDEVDQYVRVVEDADLGAVHAVEALQATAAHRRQLGLFIFYFFLVWQKRVSGVVFVLVLSFVCIQLPSQQASLLFSQHERTKGSKNVVKTCVPRYGKPNHGTENPTKCTLAIVATLMAKLTRTLRMRRSKKRAGSSKWETKASPPSRKGRR